ncbi:dTDP-4-dehydrorhamnose reductase [Algibacter pacificus]|uniref:dTDP-4-dehydrorhamnose reductase n=1 Tax=Algibacter pacificus TaxID=2599389 RepID=UPI0011C9BEF8|nr:dTDP-4-dehydrorhamnose reductase [Algibacter pacificus]
MTKVLVTGANGQLATCIKDVVSGHSNLTFIYTDYSELDICDLNKLEAYFKQIGDISYCINCAAYTAVDKAEEDQQKAYQINADGAKNLAIVCKNNNSVLIHISTDFVFEGFKNTPYIETDVTKPISVYGDSKLKGEQEIIHVLENYFIFRTSWLYSEHGNNFMKTMLRLAETKKDLSIVGDQIGTPTYAGDLAKVIVSVITTKNNNYGLYHYSNEGAISWFDFAQAIFQLSKVSINLTSISTEEYPTLAARPKYSVLNKNKIKNAFKLEIPNWKDSLKNVLLKKVN